MPKLKNRLVIKGVLVTYGEKWYVGEELYSSILLSAAYSWLSNNFTPEGVLDVDVELWKAREYGKIKASIDGYTSDLHNLAINYCLLEETLENSEVDPHKSRMYASLLLENYFTNIRSLYDFLFNIIKISLTDEQLKTIPQKESLNGLIKFSKNPRNEQKLPKRIHNFLSEIKPYLDEIRTIRDAIIHKGKEIIITKEDNEVYIRIPKSGLYSHDNILPNILESNEVNFNMNDYIREVTKSIFKYSEDLGVIILTELFEKGKYRWSIHSITNYCMEEFTDFMFNLKRT